jgi:protein-S-isoprenylcysteine O-methyltransferase Ste14
LSTLELKVPPVVVALVTAALMGIVARAGPGFRWSLPARGLLATGLALVGLLVGAMGVAAFRRARTTVNPMTPGASSSLVRSGIYRLTRNPMYLGIALTLLGWGVFLSNALALCLPAGFVLYMNRFQIGPEERALAARFGDEFAAYSSRVRRWL